MSIKFFSKVLKTLLYCFPSYTTTEDKDADAV